MENIEQERAAFEAWYRHHHGGRDVYARDESGEYTDKSVQGAFNVWQAALQSQESMERVINAARDAMDASFEHDDGYQDLVSIPSEKAASLSLALDEYDRTNRN